MAGPPGHFLPRFGRNIDRNHEIEIWMVSEHQDYPNDLVIDEGSLFDLYNDSTMHPRGSVVFLKSFGIPGPAMSATLRECS